MSRFRNEQEMFFVLDGGSLLIKVILPSFDLKFVLSPYYSTGNIFTVVLSLEIYPLFLDFYTFLYRYHLKDTNFLGVSFSSKCLPFDDFIYVINTVN